MPKKKASYEGIFKSTIIIGGSQVFQILMGVIRTKVVALMLGPAGLGLIGLYQSLVDMVRNSTSMGINLSGVRDIAEAKYSSDSSRLSLTAKVLRRWSLLTGILGFLVIILFSTPFSKYSFGTGEYKIQIIILSHTLIFTSIYQGNLALFQGIQQYKIIAKVNIAISILSILSSVPFYMIWGEKGIVPSLISISFSNMIVTLFFIKKLKLPITELSIKDTLLGGLKMGKLGIFMVINGFLATGTLLLIKSFLSAQGGIEDVGLFQASWTVSTIYIGIVLNAMMTDFFPRLSSNNSNNDQINALTNEQSEITLILGAPLLAILLVFSKLIITILYSSEFLGSIKLLQWQIFGSFLTLISWPIGVIFLAKGKGLFSVILDFSGSVLFIAIGFLMWNKLGLVSFGLSAVCRSIFAVFIVFLLAKKASGFYFSRIYLKLIILYVVPFALCFIFSLIDLNVVSLAIQITCLSFIISISVYLLSKRVNLYKVINKLKFWK